MKARTLAGIAAVAAILVAVWLLWPAAPVQQSVEPEPSALVRTAAVSAGDLSEPIVSFGTVAADPASISTLSAERDSRILAVRVHPGDRVAAGDVLMTLGGLAADQAQLAQAQSALASAERELARVQKLHKDGFASKEQLATAERAVADARALLQALEAGGADGIDLKAPSNGVVLTLGGGVGQTLTSGTPAATIAEDDALIVTAGFEPEDAIRMTPGLKADLASPRDGSTVQPGTVLAVGGAVDVATRFVHVTLKPDAIHGLLPGATLTVTVYLAPSAGLVVPRSALMEDADGVYVFAVSDGTAARTPVTVAFETSDMALITEGLAEGTRIVTEGAASLAGGMKVREAQS